MPNKISFVLIALSFIVSSIGFAQSPPAAAPSTRYFELQKGGIPYNPKTLPVPVLDFTGKLSSLSIQLDERGQPDPQSTLFQSLNGLFNKDQEKIGNVNEVQRGKVYNGQLLLTHDTRVNVALSFLKSIRSTWSRQGDKVVPDSGLSSAAFKYLEAFFPEAAAKLEAVRLSRASSGLKAALLTLPGRYGEISGYDTAMKNFDQLVLFNTAYGELVSKGVVSENDKALFIAEADAMFGRTAASFNNLVTQSWGLKSVEGAKGFQIKVADFMRKNLVDNASEPSRTLMTDVIQRRFETASNYPFRNLTTWKENFFSRTSILNSLQITFFLTSAWGMLQSSSDLHIVGSIMYGLATTFTVAGLIGRSVDANLNVNLLDAILRGDRNQTCRLGLELF